MAAENLPLAHTTTYGVQICHNHSEGIVASPVAGAPPQNCSLVRVHAGFETISVYWTAVSEGKPPVLPSHKAYLDNGNRLFMGGERVGVVTPTLAGHIWHAAGVFHFVVGTPEGLSSQMPLAKCPWEGTAAQDFYLPAENFQAAGILNQTWIQPPGIAPHPAIAQLNQTIRPRA